MAGSNADWASGPSLAPGPRVLFVCVGNAARSQMAEAFARHYGLDAESAGTEPAPRVHPDAVRAMAQRGIPIPGHAPKRLDMSRLADFQRTVTMGCGVAESCPALHTDEDWGLDDPVGLPFPEVCRVRDEIESRVRSLAARLLDERGGRNRAQFSDSAETP